MVLRYKDINAFDITDITKIINSMYTEGEVSVHRAYCERTTQPLEGEVRFIQAIDQQMLPHVVREW